MEEELYRELYSKYAPEVSGEDLESKIQYALTKNVDDVVGRIYKKYTGAGPTFDQKNYINSVLGKEQQSHAEFGFTTETFTAELDKEEEKLRMSEGDTFDEEAWQTERTNKLFDFEEEKIKFQEVEEDKNLRSEILNKDNSSDGWQVSQSEDTTIEALGKYFGHGDDGYGFTYDSGTHGMDDYIKVFPPNNPYGEVDSDNFYTLEVDVDKPEARRNWKKLKTWMSKQDGVKALPDKENIERVYNGAEIDKYKLSNMEEEDFITNLETMFPQSAIKVEERDWGDGIAIDIPGMTETMFIDLQTGTSDLDRLFSTGDRKVVEGQIQKILDYAKDVYADPKPTAIAIDFKGDKIGDIYVDSYNEVKDFPRLKKMYDKIGLEIEEHRWAQLAENMHDGGAWDQVYYTIKDIDGNLLFEGPAGEDGTYRKLGGSDGDRIDTHKSDYTISDFMYKYAKEGNISYEKYDILDKERRAAFEEIARDMDIDINNPKEVAKLFQFEDRELQNVVMSSSFLDQEELKKNDIANEKLAEQYNKAFLNDYQILDKEWQDAISKAGADGITEVRREVDPWGAITIKVGIESDTIPLKKQEELIQEYSALFGEIDYATEQLKRLYTIKESEISKTRNQHAKRAKEIEAMGDVLRMNYDPGAKRDYAWGKSWSDLSNSIGVLFGNEASKEAFNKNQMRYQSMYPELTWEDAVKYDKKAEYAGTVFAENNASVFLSVATAGVGTYVGVGTKALQWTLAAQAASQGGGGKIIELWNAADNVDEWEGWLDDLDEAFEQGRITQPVYEKHKLDLETAIMENDYEWYQNAGSVITAMTVEGLATRFIGSGQYTKFGKQILGKEIL